MTPTEAPTDVSAADDTQARQALRDALDRLARRKPEVTDGRFTVTNLAAEAGVGRATVYRHQDLLDEFKATKRRARAKPPSDAAEKTDEEIIRELKAELRQLRSEREEDKRRHRATENLLAQHIQALSLTLVEKDREIQHKNSLIKHLESSSTGPAGNVVNLFPSQKD